MPIKINEVIIRAVIDPNQNEPGEGAAGLTEEDKQALVQTSVNEVLRILERKRRA